MPVITCTAESPQSTGTAEQAVINPPLPSNLNVALNAKTTITVGPFAQVFGDVAGSGPNGNVLFDVNSTQGFFSGFSLLANTVTVRAGASVGHVFGNLITMDGSAEQQSLGLDPSKLPQVPPATASTPGTVAIAVAQNQSRQLCPGQYGAISLGVNGVLNLNGGVYQVTRLTLADGARLEPSEPVVILVTGAVTTGIGSVIQPSPQSINAMGAGDIRIEGNGAINIGDNTFVRAHLLSNGKVTLGKSVTLSGAAWAKSIAIGQSSFVGIEGSFARSTPVPPPPCNDNNLCTVDSCVGSGTAIAFCSNEPQPEGTSCDDNNFCNGTARCDAAGTCQPGVPPKPGTSCADGDVCNGDETCDGVSSCLPGPPPPVDDANPCTADVCDAIDGVSHVPLPDGTQCNGNGTCTAGTCTVQSVIFSADFVSGVGATTQCDQWLTFLSQLTNSTFSSVTMSGTFDTTGVTCNDPFAATQICSALHNNGSTSVFCNGRVWNVGNCGDSTELSADGSTCVCDTGYVARPCIQRGQGNPNWGGMNTETCFARSQNMTVVCQ